MATLTRDEVLALLPQQEPFRFVDEILELDDEHVVSRVTFRDSQDFYRGHFPGNPVTPGVILLEAMAQAGSNLLALHLLAQEYEPDVLAKATCLFTDAEVEFLRIVRPGETVTVRGAKQWFRRRKLRTTVSMELADGTEVSRGAVSGLCLLP